MGATHIFWSQLGQGAAQAVEDGAALTACLGERRDDVTEALKLYETVRLPRASRVQQISRENKDRYHLPDGPAQQERDANLAKGTIGWSPQSISWLYGHDAAELPESASTAR